MDSEIVPRALQDRLGGEATAGLIDLLTNVRTDLREDVITASAERFERRLVEEISGVRVQVAQTDASIRQDMTRMGAELRDEMTRRTAELRQEITRTAAELRQDMARMEGQLREAMAGMRADLLDRMSADRFELLKWAFLFWIGQVVAIATVVGVMIRLSGR